MRRRTLLAASSLAAALGPVQLARAADPFPSKPIRIVVSFSAGALTDIIARLYAEKLTPLLGQPVIVENRPGAGGVTASQYILAQPADGLTLEFVSSGHAVNPALYTKLPYDTLKDFQGVALLAASPSLVVVNAEHPAKTLGQLIDMAKQKPGALTFGSAGIGSATHLVGEYFCTEEMVKMLHIPYKGVQEAVAAVVGQQLDCAFPPIALAQSLISAGRLRALAVTSPERAPAVPDEPTVAELGAKGFDYAIWYALVARAGTPSPILERLIKDIDAVSAMPDVQERLKAQGLIRRRETGAAFDRYIASEIDKLGKLVKASGVEPQ